MIDRLYVTFHWENGSCREIPLGGVVRGLTHGTDHTRPYKYEVHTSPEFCVDDVRKAVEVQRFFHACNLALGFKENDAEEEQKVKDKHNPPKCDTCAYFEEINCADIIGKCEQFNEWVAKEECAEELKAIPGCADPDIVNRAIAVPDALHFSDGRVLKIIDWCPEVCLDSWFV